MQIDQYLAQESCAIGLEAEDKETVIRKIAELLAKSPAAKDIPLESIVAGLMEREELGTTGLGNGVAVPHCKIEEIDDFCMALAVSPRGMPFEAMDGRSVHIVCGIVGPEGDPDTHLRLLAAAARMLSIGRIRYEMVRSASRFALREAFLYHTSISASCRASGEECRKLLVIVLQEERAYQEIMELFLEMDIPGAVTHSGSLMSETLSAVPLFAGFMDVLGRSKPETRTILALVPETSLDDMLAGIEEITGDLDSHRGACIMVLSPDMVRGSMETI